MGGYPRSRSSSQETGAPSAAHFPPKKVRATRRSAEHTDWPAAQASPPQTSKRFSRNHPRETFHGHQQPSTRLRQFRDLQPPLRAGPPHTPAPAPEQTSTHSGMGHTS